MSGMSIEQILAEREKTHGCYKAHADITQSIKLDMSNTPQWAMLENTQREALDMIAHKIGRILAGNPSYKDHWDDIAGYATLVSKSLTKADK